MGKLYTVDDGLIEGGPELRIGDRIYRVDDRLSAFEKISAALKAEGGNEFEIIIGGALGGEAYSEIAGMDMPFPAMRQIIALILAAIQGITEEEAERRFRG